MSKTKNRSGRPNNNQRRDLSRDSILIKTLDLARKTPLHNLSIAAVAREMDITPALIHYYVGNRDQLISGVMNLFYQQLVVSWPDQDAAWQPSLTRICNHLFGLFTEFGGIAAYASSNSRFRVFQLVEKDEPDYGVLVLEKFAGTVRKAGLSRQRTGIYAHLLMELIISTAHATAQHMFPKEHKTFLKQKAGSLNKKDFPNIHFAKQAPLNLDGSVAFNEALKLYLQGLESERAVETGITQ